LDDLFDRDERPPRRQHDLALHADDPPELHVPAPVCALCMHDADVGPERANGRELLAGPSRASARSTPKGRLAAPAAYAAAISACECSSSSSGAGHPFSTASRKRRSDPTPGLPPQENTSLRAQPIPINWS